MCICEETSQCCPAAGRWQSDNGKQTVQTLSRAVLPLPKCHLMMLINLHGTSKHIRKKTMSLNVDMFKTLDDTAGMNYNRKVFPLPSSLTFSRVGDMIPETLMRRHSPLNYKISTVHANQPNGVW